MNDDIDLIETLEVECEESFNEYERNPTIENKQRLELANLRYLSLSYVPDVGWFIPDNTD